MAHLVYEAVELMEHGWQDNAAYEKCVMETRRNLQLVDQRATKVVSLHSQKSKASKTRRSNGELCLNISRIKYLRYGVIRAWTIRCCACDYKEENYSAEEQDKNWPIRDISMRIRIFYSTKKKG